MIAQSEPAATLDDLMRVEGRAELVGVRIIHIPLHGFLPGRVELRVLRSLEDDTETRIGEAFTGGIVYAIDPALPSGRQSFSPDVSFFTGPLPTNLMKFINGAPTFAVEVRSENDYGPAKETEHAEKRKDYFAAGTLVVWDVDPVNETVTVYTSADPLAPTVFRRGETADAEPAVPGWRLAVDALFA